MGNVLPLFLLSALLTARIDWTAFGWAREFTTYLKFLRDGQPQLIPERKLNNTTSTD